MIEEMLEAKAAMPRLYWLLAGLVSDAERTYCASGNADDKHRWDKLMQSRDALIEAMCHFCEAGSADIVPAAKTPPAAPLNANGKAL